MENTLLMTPPKKPDKPADGSRENYLTYSVNYTDYRPDTVTGAAGKQKSRETPAEVPEDTEKLLIPESSDELSGLHRQDSPAGETIPEPAELPRAARSVYRRRSGIPPLYVFLSAAGMILGIYIAASVPAADLSGSLLCSTGDFLGLLLRRLAWGSAFLAAEYVCGYFALGSLLVWIAPLVCGLGTGAALSGAFALNGMNALTLIPGCAGCAAAVIFAAGTSSAMSSQLLRLVSSDKNSIVSTSPAAGEYTLRFLVYLAILSACAIAEAALRCA